jgi:hypothetical protein
VLELSVKKCLNLQFYALEIKSRASRPVSKFSSFVIAEEKLVARFANKKLAQGKLERM